MDNLPELRDIHLPSEDISVFPLAYGWWLLPLMAVGIYLLYMGCKYLRRTSAKIYANHLLRPLRDIPDLTAAIKMSEILRRICVRKYPQAVALCGDEWIKFLNEKSKSHLTDKDAQLLLNAPCMSAASFTYTTDEVMRLWLFCRNWIGDNL